MPFCSKYWIKVLMSACDVSLITSDKKSLEKRSKELLKVSFSYTEDNINQVLFIHGTNELPKTKMFRGV